MIEADETDNGNVGIWAEHEGAFRAFLSICTQFRWVSPGDGTAQRVGLDYQAARAGLDAEEITVTPQLWSDIRMIELGAITPDQEGPDPWL